MNHPDRPTSVRRSAAVTGADQPIGAAVARALAWRDTDLALMGRDGAALARLAGEIAGRREPTGAEPLRLHAQTCDVTQDDHVTAAFAAARAALGDITILVNATDHGGPTPVENLAAATMEELFNVNVAGAWRCLRQLLPAMQARGHGRIVNVASTAGVRAYPRLAATVAGHHGLIGLTRALALDLGPHGITVNAVCPGWTDSELTRRVIDDTARVTGRSAADALASLIRPMGLGRLIEPREVAEVVAWLCSDDAASTTGQVLAVAGGEG